MEVVVNKNQVRIHFDKFVDDNEPNIQVHVHCRSHKLLVHSMRDTVFNMYIF
jgi:hypothetical protein